MTIAVDVETTGLDARKDSLRIVSIDGDVYDVWDKDEMVKAKERLKSHQNETLIAHNAIFDLDFLAEHLSYKHKGPIFDTMIAWQIIQNGRDVPARLGYVTEKLLQKTLDKSMQKADWGGLLLGDALEYAAEDTRVLKPLYDKLVKLLNDNNLYNIMQLEMLLLPVLLEAKRKGIYVDVSAARRLQEELQGEASTLIKELPDKLNPRSPQQVADYFNLPNSLEETLREASNQYGGRPLLRKVMAIRKIYKKISSIEKQIIGFVRYDGRIHPNFTQCFTETGRLSARDPNLQNQDRGSDIRSIFKPINGCKFVIADYSQLEVRIAAMVSKDQNLLEVLWDDQRDMHTETQRKIFGDPSSMSKAEKSKTRTLSKNILFGSLFGGGPNTVVRFAAKSDVVISEDEAREFQKQLFTLYPGLKEWHGWAGNTKPAFVYSLQGRRRYITPGEGYCTRINHPVQSSAADGQKLAMVLLAKKGLVPVANVHDELVFEIPSERAEDALSEVESVMVEGMYRATKQDPHKPIVPIKVEAKIASDWSEK